MQPTAELDGKTFMVTGANTGIGRATTADLASRGARVILACRSAQRTEPVMADITAATGNDQLEHLAGQRGQTAQGFELAFGTNHLGHFALVTAMLNLLVGPDTQSAANDAGPPRVVMVSSDSHYSAKGLPEDRLRRATRSITGMPEYARSKLANVLFTQELARRVPADQLAVHALDPGVVASDIWRRVPWPVRPLMTARMASTTDGARTSLWCATSADLNGTSGGYYADCAAKDPSDVATAELGAWLWERSEEWIS